MSGTDDTTRVWLLRTQQLRRTPALRGGEPLEARAWRRQAACGLAALAAVLCCVVGLSLRAPTASRPDQPTRLVSGPTRLVDVSPRPAALPALIPPDGEVPGLLSTTPENTLSILLGPAPGSVAPPAPIWLDSSYGDR